MVASTLAQSLVALALVTGASGHAAHTCSVEDGERHCHASHEHVLFDQFNLSTLDMDVDVTCQEAVGASPESQWGD